MMSSLRQIQEAEDFKVGSLCDIMWTLFNLHGPLMFKASRKFYASQVNSLVTERIDLDPLNDVLEKIEIAGRREEDWSPYSLLGASRIEDEVEEGEIIEDRNVIVRDNPMMSSTTEMNDEMEMVAPDDVLPPPPPPRNRPEEDVLKSTELGTDQILEDLACEVDLGLDLDVNDLFDTPSTPPPVISPRPATTPPPKPRRRTRFESPVRCSERRYPTRRRSPTPHPRNRISEGRRRRDYEDREELEKSCHSRYSDNRVSRLTESQRRHLSKLKFRRNKDRYLKHI